MKSFNEYVEGIEGKGKMGYSPSKENLEKWVEEDKKNKEHDERMDKVMKLAQVSFNMAVDQADGYNSLDDAVDAYAQNAMESAADMEEEGLSAADGMTASDMVYRLYNKYKEQLKNK